MGGHAKLNDLPSSVTDHEPGVQQAELDGGEAHGEAQLFEFGLDLSGTPAVLIRKSTNQGLHFERDGRSTGTALRNGSPVQPETLAVPTDDGVWLDDDQGLFPTRPIS